MKHLKVSNAILTILLTLMLSGFAKEKPIPEGKSDLTTVNSFSICDFTYEMIAEVHELKTNKRLKEFIIPSYDPHESWSWWRVAKEKKVNFCLLLLLNDVANANQLKAGQTIFLPVNNNE